MLEKTYDAKAVEPKIAKVWEEADAFRAGAGAEEGAEAFTIVIPPPNVTGSLHMGHALNNTLQDILVRFERMRGKNVLWQPGMDHAGIATQMVVERQLMEKQIHRRDLTREQFIEKVWEWKAESGGTIFNQLKRLGASGDWSRERFTMDEGLSKAVLEVFVTLYKEGLIYKDKRLVNWDPKLLTAISDLEVEQQEVNGNLWHFRYPIEGEVFDPENPKTFITVATTRPETMLGDTAVAVHPDDERFRHLVGKNIVLPIVGRKIPVVADEYSDPEKGSGAVKITPAHDFNDFEVGKRHKLPAINILTVEAAINLKDNEDFLAGLEVTPERQAVWDELHGLDRFVARKKIVELMEAGGFLEKVEPHRHAVPHGDRGGVPIEPFLTDQWYVNAAELAKPAIASVREGRTNFVPKNWEKTYFDWMENIQPWCISRQLWWGHQIPAWYGPDGRVFVEKTEEEALGAAIEYYLALEGPWKAWVEDKLENFKPGEILTRDEDVLDTWFSSALWPFSTLGWPDQTPELKTYYQTDVLVTGFDIIFFWVARMMMMGLHFMDEEPFHTVYVHALVRDKNGQKMSKSKGNVIDPLDLIDEYGADALRFTLTVMAAQGRDVKLDPARIAGYRNFGTKLWNATRFAEMNEVARNDDFWLNDAKLTVNRWILTELTRAAREITDGITSYRFNEAAGRCLPLRLEPVLRLVSGTAEAGVHGHRRGGQGRKPRLRRLRARRDLQAPAPDDAVHDRGTVGADRGRGQGAAVAAVPCRMAVAGLRGRGGGRRHQLAGRSRLRHPLGALGDERAAGGDRAAGRGRRQRRDTRTAGAPGVGDQAAGAGRRHLAGRCRAQGLGADRAQRGDRSACRSAA